MKKDPSEIPEVQEFIEIQDEIEGFKRRHNDVFEKFSELTESYNQKLEAAEKACRSQRVSCGPFDLYQTQTTYEPKMLYDALGRDRFLQVGGIINMQTVYDLDKAKVEVAINKNLIPSDVVENFRKQSPRYHKPKPVSV